MKMIFLSLQLLTVSQKKGSGPTARHGCCIHGKVNFTFQMFQVTVEQHNKYTSI